MSFAVTPGVLADWAPAPVAALNTARRKTYSASSAMARRPHVLGRSMVPPSRTRSRVIITPFAAEITAGIEREAGGSGR